MENMTGLLNAAFVNMCLKQGMVLQLLDWVACVCNFIDIAHIVIASSMWISCMNEAICFTIFIYEIFLCCRCNTHKLPGFTYQDFSFTYSPCWICLPCMFHIGKISFWDLPIYFIYKPWGLSLAELFCCFLSVSIRLQFKNLWCVFLYYKYFYIFISRYMYFLNMNLFLNIYPQLRIKDEI